MFMSISQAVCCEAGAILLANLELVTFFMTQALL